MLKGGSRLEGPESGTKELLPEEKRQTKTIND